MASPQIHPTAVVDPSALLGVDVVIGPHVVVGALVEIGDGTTIGPHVILEDRTILGRNCQLSSASVIGGPPQDLAYKGEPTRVRVGDNTLIREYVTINRSTGEGTETTVGDNSFIMGYSHIAHNCKVGNEVIMANLSQMAGHVQIGDYVFLGGSTLIHQYCRVGRYAMLGGGSGTRQDIAPFSMNEGRKAYVRGINTIGLRRRGFTAEERQNLKKAFFYLWFSGLNQTQALEAIHENLTVDQHLQELLDFIQSSKRGICYRTEGKPEESEAEQTPLSV